VSRWANKYVIGLTGNIAVGKSVVRQMLQHLGAYTIDADGLTHQATAPGAPGYAPVVEMFGKFMLDSEGRINRSILGNIVFSYPDALAKLEAIVHPVVLQAINTLVSRAQQRVIVIEAIKLLETDLAGAVDSIWVVDAAPETQLKRLLEKRQMSEEEARKRIVAQRPQADKIARANFIIRNDGNVEETWKQVQAAWTEMMRTVAPSPATPAPTPAPTAPQPTPTAPARPAAAAQPAKAAPQPTPTAPAAAAAAAVAAAPATAAAVGSSTITVRRGMPGNAELIASFISRFAPNPVSRMDIMMAFGQKSYLLAQDGGDKVAALIGWQVENLITRADEFYIDPAISAPPVIASLVTAIEDASRELQSEVCFILLPAASSDTIIQSFVEQGYEPTTLQEIRVPAWREAVAEISGDTLRILTKKLRPDRVMKPI
jgi:dephospho-CoA kinase